MIYLSKGVVFPNSTADNLFIQRGSERFHLNGLEAELWLRGRFAFAKPLSGREQKIIEHYAKLGLFECEFRDSMTSEYHILTRCVCCPTIKKGFPKPLSKTEKTFLTWIEDAGLRLTFAELVYLMEHHVQPTPDLLHEENRQALVERIYTSGNIADNLLEFEMKEAQCRNYAIGTVLKLLKKKRVVIL